MSVDDSGMDTVQPDRLVDVHDLAEVLDLPPRWLQTEAKAGRIPSLNVGRELMFNVSAVRDGLLKRAAEYRITTSDSNTPVQAGGD